MKSLLSLVCFFHFFCVIPYTKNNITEPRTLIVSIHENTINNDDNNKKIQQVIDQVNNLLIQDGKIMPSCNFTLKEASFFSYLSSLFYKWYCFFTFPRYSFAHPEKENRSFIYDSHNLKNTGVYTIYIPDGVAQHYMHTLLEDTLKKQGVHAWVEPNHIVTLEYLTASLSKDLKYGYPLLDGQSLTSYELDQILHNKLQQEIDNFLHEKSQKLGISQASEKVLYPYLSSLEKKWIDQKNKLKNFVNKTELYTVWWQSIPSIGMRQAEPFWPLMYPFIPHMFSLWDLAPSLGENSSIYFIDTGIAAFNFNQSVYKNSFKKNKNIEMIANFNNQQNGCYNFVNNTLDILNNNKKNQLVSLGYPNDQKNIPFENIPIAFIADETMHTIDQKIATYTSGHGTHTACIACGKVVPSSLVSLYKNNPQEILSHSSGITGIAPASKSIMLKTFSSMTSTATIATILQGLEKAVNEKSKILNMSMKITDIVDYTQSSIQKIENLLSAIPYTVSSVGNSTKHHVPQDREAYPASSDKVAFDVGAFSFYQDTIGDYYCPIPEWSRYQTDIGPKFVEPGQNILSAGLIPQQKSDSMYVFMQGTSAATSFISGFLALMLSEFSGVFDNEKTLFLTVCYASGLYMHDDHAWKTKTIFGTLDFRLALFTCHVLAALQKKGISLEKNLHQFIAIIHIIIFNFVDHYGKELAITKPFRANFMGYFNQIRKKEKTDFFKKISAQCSNVKNSVNFVRDLVLDIQHKKTSEFIPPSLHEKAQIILENPAFSLFSDLPEKVQARITYILKD